MKLLIEAEEARRKHDYYEWVEMWRSVRFSLNIRTKDVPERQPYEHIRKVVICPHAGTRDDAIFTVLNPEDKFGADEDKFYEEDNHNVNQSYNTSSNA